jgi:hypothetical protein
VKKAYEKFSRKFSFEKKFSQQFSVSVSRKFSRKFSIRNADPDSGATSIFIQIRNTDGKFSQKLAKTFAKMKILAKAFARAKIFGKQNFANIAKSERIFAFRENENKGFRFNPREQPSCSSTTILLE